MTRSRLAWLAGGLALLAGAGAVGQDSTAPSVTGDDPVVTGIEVGGVDLSRVPPRPWHADQLIERLLRKRSLILMRYGGAPPLRTISREALLGLEVGIVAQEVEAYKLADRLSMFSAHRIRWEPRDADALVSLREKRVAVGMLPELLRPWGEDCQIR